MGVPLPSNFLCGLRNIANVTVMNAPTHIPAGKLAIDRDRHVVSIHVSCESTAAALELYRDLIGRARETGGLRLEIALQARETIDA